MESILNNKLKKIDDTIAEGKFRDTWESLYDYQIPEWYRRAKLGIFFHYGVYTVPENQSEWYSRNMYIENSKSYDFHLMKYGAHKQFGYKELIPLFTAEKFKASKWLDLADTLGAKYIIPVAEHHDGFQMYSSELSKFNSYEMGPKIDFIKELEAESKKRNIKFAVSSHRAEHYWFMDGALDFDSGIDSPKYGDLYWPTIKEDDLNKDEKTTKLFLEDWLVRCCELVDLFKPRVVYFDWWVEMPIFKPYMRKFLAYYYNCSLQTYGDHGVVNYKHDGVPYMVAVRDVERGQFDSIQLDYWQCCTSSARNSWSYTKQNEYKTSREVIQTLIDVISKNGNLLLNSGPRKDGTICDQEKKLFTEIGKWVKTNHEAIYDTTPWKKFGEGENYAAAGNFSEGNLVNYTKFDFRFNQNKNKIYIFVMNPQNETTFEVKSMAKQHGTLTCHAVINNIRCLDPRVSVKRWERKDNYLQLNIAEHDIDLPLVFELDTE